MALEKEIWVQDIEEQLFENNQFMNYCVDHSSYINNKIVHIPIAGAAPGVQKNRSSVPATIAERTDTDSTYQIDEYTTDPILIKDFDQVQISYNKRQSVLKAHTDVIRDRLAKELLTTWAPALAGRMIRTSGADATTALAAGATGTRKAVTIDDIANLSKILDNDNTPASGRYLLMNSAMYYQLFTIEALARYDYYGKATLPDGVINQLFGFNIIVKPTLPVYDHSSTPVVKAVGASSAVTDHLACIAWQESYVAKALGDIKVYLNDERADYYGSIFSAMVPFGGNKIRTSTETGVAALIQSA